MLSDVSDTAREISGRVILYPSFIVLALSVSPCVVTLSKVFESRQFRFRLAPAFRPIHPHFHHVAQIVCRPSDTSILPRKAESSLLDSALAEPALLRLEQPKHRLALISIFLAAAPAHDTNTVVEELEVVERVRWVGWRDVVGEPELRGWVDGNVDGGNGVLVTDQCGGWGEGVVGMEWRGVLWDGKDIELRH